MRISLSILITAFVRSNKKEAVDAREFAVSALQGVCRFKIQVYLRGVAADTFDMMLNVLEDQSWNLELHVQIGSELRSRSMGISFYGRCQSGSAKRNDHTHRPSSANCGHSEGSL